MRPAARPHLPTLARLAALLSLLAAGIAHAAEPPLHDKVVVVVMENKTYDQTRVQPYTASLIAAGALFTNSFGVARPSQPNYIALWAGNTFGVSTNACPAPGSPFPYENLGHACEVAGLTWRAFSENLPSAGSAVCSADGDQATGLYTRKHEPWTHFSNLNHANERPYSDLAATLAAHALPNLTFIIPNNCHNTHNAFTAGCTVPDGDAWLAANLPSIIAELGPNGLLILTWDEDDETGPNHILTVFHGPKVTAGSSYGARVTHYTVSRLLCEVLGLEIEGFGIFENPITGIWTSPVPTTRASWGGLKTIYH
jgi:acid phosphatase